MARPSFYGDSVGSIGYRLSVLRRAYRPGMPQRRFADYLGITAQAWNNYELGLSRPELDAALKVARITGVSLDWIYRGQESMLPVDLANRMREIVASDSSGSAGQSSVS